MGYLLIVASMLIWGSIGVFVRSLEVGSAVIAFYRVLFAVLCLGTMAVVRRRSLQWKEVKQHKLPLLITGVLLAANWVVYFQALRLTTVAKAVLSYYTAPIWVTVLAPLVLKERLELRSVAALLLALAGLGVMIGSEVLTTARDWLGILLGCAAAWGYAGTVLISKKYLTSVPTTLLVLAQCSAALPLLLPWGIAARPAMHDLLILIVLGAVHTALAYLLYFKGIQTVKVQHASVLSYLDPVSAVIFSIAILHEMPQVSALFGGLLILTGSALLLLPAKVRQQRALVSS